MKKHALRSVLMVLLLFFTGAWPSALAQPEAFSYRIDPDLEPALPELPGIGGGAERPVGAVLEPDGVRGDYVVDGDFGTVYSVSVGPPYYVYVPLVIKE